MINDFDESEQNNDLMINATDDIETPISSERISGNVENRYTEINNFLLNPIEGYNENENSPQILNSENNQNNNSNFHIEYNLKIILLGEIGVGKSSLISRYLYSNSNEKNNNEVYDKKLELDNNTIANISIYDTIHQEKLGKFTKDYFRDSNGALIVFDLCNIDSFNKISFWINELKDNAPGDIVYALIGNKSDRNEERKVKFEEATELAGDNLYYEVSAKSGNNVSLAFEQLISGVIDKINEEENNPDKVLRGKEGRKTTDLKDIQNFNKNNKKCCL